MSRKKPRFILNEARILVLNTLHHIYLEGKALARKVEIKTLLAYLNSDRVLSRLKNIGRIYGGGLLKVEPRELERLLVVDLSKYARKDAETLANLFDQLCISVRNKSGEQEIRKEIDCIIG